jgi:hypothetical protein
MAQVNSGNGSFPQSSTNTVAAVETHCGPDAQVVSRAKVVAYKQSEPGRHGDRSINPDRS